MLHAKHVAAFAAVLAVAAGLAMAADAMKDGKLPPDYQSPTLGAKPPAGATVLLPYEPGKAPSLDAWTNTTWKADPEGFIVKGKGDQVTRADLGDMQLHAEFNIPPGEDGKKPPSDGNSGLYIMDRYEIQILDTYGAPIADHICGSVYRKIAPTANAALPTGKWQTYDITFHAPKFDSDGKKTASVRVTVVLNGVKVQDNVEVPAPTGAAGKKPEVAKAPLRLQDHGCDVKFRNIWLTPIKGE
jgi:hypothetical protein